MIKRKIVLRKRRNIDEKQHLIGKESISILAICISIMSLVIAFSTRLESIDISNVGKGISILNGLQSFRDDIDIVFRNDAKNLLNRARNVMGDDYCIKNAEKLKVIYFKKAVHDLVNSSDYEFFKRHGLENEFINALSVIDDNDTIQLMKFIFTNDFTNVDRIDFIKLENYNHNMDLNILYSKFDNLIFSLDMKKKSVKTTLGNYYKKMLTNQVVNIDITKDYFEYKRKNFGFTKVTNEVEETDLAVFKITFSEAVVLGSFDQVIAEITINRLYEQSIRKGIK